LSRAAPGASLAGDRPRRGALRSLRAGYTSAARGGGGGRAFRASSRLGARGNRTLRREFSFANFRDAFGLVARVAPLAESEGHHPDIELGWGRAAFSLTTHAAGGLTRNDFIMAARIDRLAAG
jgi:pterin-4a-carbinolamine dehydratase